ncbi:hypothetical protein BASA61_000891 [Batrachochytrium salamandrivorans]|nr:hypothetical protein BASA61_000891 [Batrachochytrium salamandrivorans]
MAKIVKTVKHTAKMEKTVNHTAKMEKTVNHTAKMEKTVNHTAKMAKTVKTPAAEIGISSHNQSANSLGAMSIDPTENAPTSKPTLRARPRHSASRMRLLREITSLGGDATDLDLLEDVLSGSEREDNDEDGTAINRGSNAAPATEQDEQILMKDLMAFMTGQLNIDPSKSAVEVASEDDGSDSQENEQDDDQDKPAPKKDTVAIPLKADKSRITSIPAQPAVPKEPVRKASQVHDTLAESSRTQTNYNDYEDENENETADADDTGATYGKEDEADVQQMVAQLLKGETPVDKLQLDLLIEPSTSWWDTPLGKIDPISSLGTPVNPEGVSQKYVLAKSLWEEEMRKFDKVKQSTGSRADKDFISTILKSGTTTDKISALTLLIQEAPLHKFALLNDHLIHGMARKKSRREAMLTIDSIKDLFLNSILPDRKLKYFVDRPVFSKNVTRKHLILWVFEDSLKKAYFSFIQLIEELAKDPLSHVKNKMMACVFDLLATKPEEEQNLLLLLVNKLGDLDKKLASKSVHLLSQLVLRHPAMKIVIIKEIERLLFRSNIAERAQYYAVTFLNQIVLTHGEADTKAANLLIDVYFKLFESLVHKIRLKEDTAAVKPGNGKPVKKSKNSRYRKQDKHSKHGKKNSKATGGSSTTALPSSEAGDGLKSVDGVDSKMMAALLTGVNRAFPFAKLDSEVFELHLNTLFKITHIATFNTCIQSLTLIFQVQSSRQMVSDRFYRALYDTLLDQRLFEASKQSMYLNLLFKALRADDAMNRVRSFVKRLVQICFRAQVPLICGSLFLVSELAKHHLGLWAFITQPEDHDDEEHFVDAPLTLDIADLRSVKGEADSGQDKDNLTNTSAQTMDAVSTSISTHTVPSTTAANAAGSVRKYDGRKRDPLYTNADQVCLWELCAFSTHFHPTVSLYARTLLSGSPIVIPSISTNYDPLLNHTLSRFLDRFVFKTPKKAKSVYHGSSLMQPRVMNTSSALSGDASGTADASSSMFLSDNLLAGGRRKQNILYADAEHNGDMVSLDDRPANLVHWARQDKVGVSPDDMFFYKFFTERTAKTRHRKGAAGHSDDLDGDDFDSDQDIEDDVAWEAMTQSSGFPSGGNGDDPIDSDDDDAIDDDDAMGPFSGDDNEGDETGEFDDEIDFQVDPDAASEGGSDLSNDGDMDAWASQSTLKTVARRSGVDSADADHDDEQDEDADEFDADLADAFIDEEDDDDDDEDDEVASVEAGDAAGPSDIKATKGAKRLRLKDRLKTRALEMGYSGDYFTGGDGNEFASADDFSALLDRRDNEDAMDAEDGDGDDMPTGRGGRKHTGSTKRSGKRGLTTDVSLRKKQRK